MYVRRAIEATLLEVSRQFPVVVLTGPRQVGKTTVLENTFPDAAYVTLDAALNAEEAESRPSEFLDRFPTPLIIDEIQYAPSLLRHIKARVDEDRSRRRRSAGRYLITGSQSFPLMQSVTESLAGRAAILVMHGLSFAEWRSAIAEAPAMEYLFRGGYPALWNTPEDPIQRDRWYPSYVSTYIERDVRNLLRVGRLRDFERFLRACALRTGQLLNMADLARDVGIAPSTAGEWISVLEASQQIFLLEPYHESRGKRLVKRPKLYFQDTGLALFLAGYASAAALRASPAVGAFWENHVIGQWRRWQHWEAPAANLWFWQNQQQLEVDLVVEYEGRLHPIECKYKELPDDHDARGLRAFAKFYPPERLAPGQLASLSPNLWTTHDGIGVRPGWSPWPLGLP